MSSYFGTFLDKAGMLTMRGNVVHQSFCLQPTRQFRLIDEFHFACQLLRTGLSQWWILPLPRRRNDIQLKLMIFTIVILYFPGETNPEIQRLDQTTRIILRWVQVLCLPYRCKFTLRQVNLSICFQLESHVMILRIWIYKR